MGRTSRGTTGTDAGQDASHCRLKAEATRVTRGVLIILVASAFRRKDATGARRPPGRRKPRRHIQSAVGRMFGFPPSARSFRTAAGTIGTTPSETRHRSSALPGTARHLAGRRAHTRSPQPARSHSPGRPCSRGEPPIRTENIHLVLLILYSVGVVAFGVWTSRFVPQSRDFFVGGRSLGPGLICSTRVGGLFRSGILAMRSTRGLAFSFWHSWHFWQL